ncbi:MAG: site-2 protease family protein [Desulfurivibrionaceae bacterium]
MSIIQQIIILAPPFLFALTIHEYCHGWVAFRFGDPTARAQGRLTLNPLKHLDPLGVLAFIIMKIGWAKPVPVDHRYFKDPMKDMIWVSLAGPGANLLTALASAVLAWLVALISPVIPEALLFPLYQMLAASVWINIVLAFFNLLPIPPLDGSKVLMGLLPRRQADLFIKLEPFGFLILLGLFYAGIIQKILMPIINFAHSIIAI